MSAFLLAGVEPKPREGQTKLRCPGRDRRRNMKKKELEKLMMLIDLQRFAEGDGGEGAGDGDKDGNGGDGGEEGKETPRTYTDADVDRIVAKHKAQWEAAHKKDLDTAREEARKYERMTKEQKEAEDKKKADEEAAKKDARIAELEAKIANDELRRSVAADVEAMPEGITASQDFLDLTVVGDADAAKANVSKLVSIILADRKAQEEKRARGTTPKDFGRGQEVDPYQAIVNKYKR